MNLSRIILTLAMLLLVSACSERASHDTGARKVIKLWVAPNPAEERFWTIAVERWNKLGRGTPVEFTTIPATGGSEEAILTALVSGSGPDISTNIFPGFAVQLANLGQLQDISGMPGFEQIKASRQMTQILEDARVHGHQYVMPMYYTPILVWWRADLLKELGFKAPPQTFEDVYQLSQRRAQRGQGAGMQVLTGREWRSRWFDYLAYFYACSDGEPYINGREATYDGAAGLAALTFIDVMYRNRWTTVDAEAEDPLSTGAVVGAIHGAWDISYYAENFPETLKHIVIGPMLRDAAGMRAGSKTHTFADAKGMVLFKSSQLQAEALAFMAWVFGDDELSLLWFQETGMPPARGDLTTNPRFAEFLRRNPLAAQYAAYVDVAHPSAHLEETIDVNKIVVQMIDSVLFDAQTVRSAAAQAVLSTNQLLKRSQ